MNMLKSKKGFTLIELLIVITIIGILAVAFLPTLLGAPAKARDTKRSADLQRIQKVLVNADLEGTALPASSGCVAGNEWTGFLSDFGGTIPADPQTGAAAPNVGGCGSSYYYVNFDDGQQYTFALVSAVEDTGNGNYNCGDDHSTVPQNNSDPTLDASGQCYAILTK